ncbi:hypothetical protein [Bacillus sp. AK128]
MRFVFLLVSLLVLVTSCSNTSIDSILTVKEMESIKEKIDSDEEKWHVGKIIDTPFHAYTVMGEANIEDQHTSKTTGPIEVSIGGAYVLFEGTKYAKPKKDSSLNYFVVYEITMENSTNEDYLFDLFGSIPNHEAKLMLNQNEVSLSVSSLQSFMGPQIESQSSHQTYLWFPITREDVNKLKTATLQIDGPYGPVSGGTELEELAEDDKVGEDLNFPIQFTNAIPTEIEVTTNQDINWSELPDAVMDEIHMTKEQFDEFLLHISNSKDIVSSIEWMNEQTIEVTINNIEGRNSFENLIRIDLLDGILRPAYKNSKYFTGEEPTFRFVNVNSEIIGEYDLPFEKRERQAQELGSFEIGDVVNDYGLEIQVLDAYYTDYRDPYSEEVPEQVLRVEFMIRNKDDRPRTISFVDFTLLDKDGEELGFYHDIENFRESPKIGEEFYGVFHLSVNDNEPYVLKYKNVYDSTATWTIVPSSY